MHHRLVYPVIIEIALIKVIRMRAHDEQQLIVIVSSQLAERN
jgi:hypothetical protein